ncbi:hypothetical protein A9Q84_17900 [Halobacteriovorax marinus]|uniref:Secreted protein n=1 Tax=Halobacteriovorax marinus TaxID=97084 RepID=A0A1Y5F399_9BACT|nr:hypothetical protein A9Q84_17900 [Halobacteriovorax marinus]
MKSLRFFAILCTFSLVNSSILAMSCPTPHSKYQDLLTKLKSVEEEIKNSGGSHCQSIAEKMSEVRSVYENGREVFTILETSISPVEGTRELSNENIEAVKNYGSEAISVVGDLISKMKAEDKCLSEDQQDNTLIAVSNVIQEVTSVAAKYTGPYGVPLSLGGNLIAGILRGIDSFKKASWFSNGYKFTSENDRLLFTKNLCIYHDIKSEVSNYINPLDRMVQLTALKVALKMKEYKTVRFYPEGKTLQGLYKNREAHLTIVKENLAKITTAKLKIENPFDECIGYAKVAHDPIQGIHGVHAMLLKGLEGLTGEAAKPAERLTKFYDFIESENGVPEEEGCYYFTDKQILVQNLKTNSMLKRYFQKVTEVYSNSMAFVQTQIKERYELDYGQWLMNTYSKLIWVESELSMMTGILGLKVEEYNKILNDAFELSVKKYEEVITSFELDVLSGEVASASLEEALLSVQESIQIRVDLNLDINRESSTYQREIIRIQKRLDERFLEKLAPKFIDFYITDRNVLLKKTRREIHSDLGDFYDDLDQDFKSLKEYFTFIKKDKSLDHAYTFAKIDGHIQNLLAVMNSHFTTQVYCKYFEKNGFRLDRIKKVCESSVMLTNKSSDALDLESISDIYNVLGEYRVYGEWAKKEGIIDSNSLGSILLKLEDCYKKIELEYFDKLSKSNVNSNKETELL